MESVFQYQLWSYRYPGVGDFRHVIMFIWTANALSPAIIVKVERSTTESSFLRSGEFLQTRTEYSGNNALSSERFAIFFSVNFQADLILNFLL